MASERTLSIIKPDAVERGLIGAIVDRFEKGGLKPVALRLERLSEAAAGGFYAVHRERPFYRDRVACMNIERNSAHGSDAPETARAEIADFFRATEQHAYDWKR